MSREDSRGGTSGGGQDGKGEEASMRRTKEAGKDKKGDKEKRGIILFIELF